MSEFTDFLTENKEQKLAIIIGGGVNGISNAFELHKKGYKTAIIDVQKDVANGCSKATWGGMSTNYSIINHSILNLFNKNNNENIEYNNFNPIYLNWKKILFDLHFLRWGVTFLLHRNWILNKYKSLNIFNKDEINVITKENTIKHMTKFVKDSVLYQIDFIKNNEYIPDLKQKCQLNDNGFVIVIRDNDKKECDNLQGLFTDKQTFKELDDGVRKLTIYDANNMSLKDIGRKIGDENLLINLPYNETIKYVRHTTNGYLADNPKFCRALKEYLMTNNSLKFFGDTNVLDFDVNSMTKRISKIYTDRGLINIENENVIVVLSGGSWSPMLGRKLGIFIPVYPLKGFDFVIDYNPMDIEYDFYMNKIPKHSMIDNDVYYVNYGEINDMNNRIRVASIGAFNGWNVCINKNKFDERIKNELYAQGMLMMPNIMNGVFDKGMINCVAGLRPLTYDTSVIVGKLKEYNNLYMSVGPGYNGWKTAMGSAKLLAGVVVDNDMQNYFEPSKHNVKKSTLFCKFTELFTMN
eukprot:423691_1